jgi:hypothetical protein
MNMRTVAIIVGSALALGVLWLLLGRRIVLLVDSIFPGSPTPIETGRLEIGDDYFAIGPSSRPLERGDAFELKVAMSQKCRLVLASGPRCFTFGQVKTRWANKPEPAYEFIPDPGDTVSFARYVSRLEWHTPFTIRFMGGPPPKRHRFAYDRLSWNKKSGAALEIIWRSDQDFTGAWYDQWNFRLIKLTIKMSPAENAAAAYLPSKGWKTSEYRLESEAPSGDEDVINAIWLEDETSAHPGGGKSVVLRVNRSTRAVQETGWQ